VHQYAAAFDGFAIVLTASLAGILAGGMIAFIERSLQRRAAKKRAEKKLRWPW
jgi:hypothetical protein